MRRRYRNDSGNKQLDPDVIKNLCENCSKHADNYLMPLIQKPSQRSQKDFKLISAEFRYGQK